MNLNDYIESGIIESYLLGLASPEVIEFFERMRTLYPDLNIELAEAEYRLQRVTEEGGVTPPAKVWNKIAARLTVDQDERYRSSDRSRIGVDHDGPTYILQPRSNTITVSIWWRCGVIALIVIIMALVASTIYFYQQFQRMEERLMHLYTIPTETPRPVGR